MKNGGPEYKALAEAGTILRVRTGSQTHGISTESSDRDEMGVCIEPEEYLLGLKNFEQYMYRDAAERTGKSDAPSLPGELDLTIYSLRKYVRLVMNGNPSMIELLFIDAPDAIISRTELGAQLQKMGREYMLSAEAGPKYLGYLMAQRRQMLSFNGKGRDVTRPHLVEKYGFDTKYAGHMIRLGLQGVELLREGRILLPMVSSESRLIRAIRQGEYEMAWCLELAEHLEDQIKGLLDGASPLRAHPDHATVNDWLVDTYQHHWFMRDQP